MKRNLSTLAAIACLTFLGVTPARTLGSTESHRAEDLAGHQKIAAAHAAAARCLQSNADGETCHKQLQAACAGLAVGTHCGLRSKPADHKDVAKHIAEHQRMAAIHSAAAQCLASDKPYRDCQSKLSKDCGGVGVGKYCGMRHAH